MARRNLMTIHIVKLCVGADSVEDLAEWQIGQLRRARKAKANAIHPHQKSHPVCGTRMWPKRLEDCWPAARSIG